MLPGGLLWGAQDALWGFDPAAGAHWRHAGEAFRGAGLKLDFAASFPAAIALWALVWWSLARAARSLPRRAAGRGGPAGTSATTANAAAPAALRSE